MIKQYFIFKVILFKIGIQFQIKRYNSKDLNLLLKILINCFYFIGNL